MNDAPKDPLTPLGEGAQNLHELMQEYVKAGFTRPEAIELVKAVIIASLGGRT